MPVSQTVPADMLQVRRITRTAGVATVSTFVSFRLSEFHHLMSSFSSRPVHHGKVVGNYVLATVDVKIRGSATNASFVETNLIARGDFNTGWKIY